MVLEVEHLLTERLILKVLDDQGAALVREYYFRNQDFLKPWEPWRAPEFYTTEFQQRDLQNQWERIQRGELFKVWLFKKEDFEFAKIVGLVSLNNIIRGYLYSGILGYGLDQTEVNKGYMTEAAWAITDFAFQALNLQRIEANIMPHNKASFRVAEKLGFRHEGLSCKYLQINGRWQYHTRMVLFNEAML